MTDVLLVTGANSYVAGHMIQKALQKGYRVRGTVRSPTSGDKLLAAFPAYTTGEDAQLGYDIVADMTKPEAYEAVFTKAAAAGHPITGIIHTASPFTMTIEDNERDMLLPARDGAVAILNAAQRYGGGAVRSVVSITSFAAIVDVTKGTRPGYTYSEADWNPVTWDEAKASPHAAVAYCASKTFAERAQWDWIKKAQEEKTEGASFVLTTIAPPWVFGPYVDPAALGIHSTAQLNESMKLLVPLVDGSYANGDVPKTDFAGFCDVRDLAAITLASYERAADPAVANQRFLAGSKLSYQTCADTIRAAFPELHDKVPVGTPGTGGSEDTYKLDSSKVCSTFGITLTPLEETIKDSVRQIITLK